MKKNKIVKIVMITLVTIILLCVVLQLILANMYSSHNVASRVLSITNSFLPHATICNGRSDGDSSSNILGNSKHSLYGLLPCFPLGANDDVIEAHSDSTFYDVEWGKIAMSQQQVDKWQLIASQVIRQSLFLQPAPVLFDDDAQSHGSHYLAYFALTDKQTLEDIIGDGMSTPEVPIRWICYQSSDDFNAVAIGIPYGDYYHHGSDVTFASFYSDFVQDGIVARMIMNSLLCDIHGLDIQDQMKYAVDNIDAEPIGFCVYGDLEDIQPLLEDFTLVKLCYDRSASE